jgi:hypothetical protein
MSINPGFTLRGLYAADDWGDEVPLPSPKEPTALGWFARRCLESGSLQNSSPSINGVISSAVIGLMLIDITNIY